MLILSYLQGFSERKSIRSIWFHSFVKENNSKPSVRFELTTPGLQDQCSNPWAMKADIQTHKDLIIFRKILFVMIDTNIKLKTILGIITHDQLFTSKYRIPIWAFAIYLRSMSVFLDFITFTFNFIALNHLNHTFWRPEAILIILDLNMWWGKRTLVYGA